MKQGAWRFDGSDYVPARDNPRLSRQAARIFNLMCDGEWRTLHDIDLATGYPEASISAQLRHFRKPRFGGHTIEKRYIVSGLYEYRLLVREKSARTDDQPGPTPEGAR